MEPERILDEVGPEGPVTRGQLETAVNVAIGAASVCWESMSGTGTFQSDRAHQISEELIDICLRYALRDDGTSGISGTPGFGPGPHSGPDPEPSEVTGAAHSAVIDAEWQERHGGDSGSGEPVSRYRAAVAWYGELSDHTPLWYYAMAVFVSVTAGFSVTEPGVWWSALCGLPVSFGALAWFIWRAHRKMQFCPCRNGRNSRNGREHEGGGGPGA